MAEVGRTRDHNEAGLLYVRSVWVVLPCILWCVNFKEMMYTIFALIPVPVHKNNLGPQRSEAGHLPDV